MAEAVKTTREVPVTTVKAEDVVTLTLTVAEAETLRFIMQAIGGDPVFSRRAHASAIGSALADAGFDWYQEGSPTFKVDYPNRAIYFSKTDQDFTKS